MGISRGDEIGKLKEKLSFENNNHDSFIVNIIKTEHRIRQLLLQVAQT